MTTKPTDNVREPGATNGTTRLEAFSDGVFAIAITLLILEFRVPTAGPEINNQRLLGELVALWPSLVAFLMSFFVILVMWVNHHGIIRLSHGVDYPVFFANGFVLLLVTFVPFPTAVLARYLGTPAANAAAAFYCGTFLVVSLSWRSLFETLTCNRRLVAAHVSETALTRIRRAYRIAPLVYAVSTVAAFWSALWTFLSYRPE